MLQQTQVITVMDYWKRWMALFPTVEALAAADESAVLHAWQGLGYYSRARSLLRGAREVVLRHQGQVPSEALTLRELPGVGRYTAGAIASIAFGRHEAVVDGNVKRVLCRLFALTGDPSERRMEELLWERAFELLSPERPGDHNQAVMELGATVCTPKRPRCIECPVRSHCQAFALARVDELPTPRARPALTDVVHVAVVCRRGKRVLVERLPDTASRWAGLWQFPTVEAAKRESVQAAGRRGLGRVLRGAPKTLSSLTTLSHGVTRFRITLEVLEATLTAREAAPVPEHELRWVELEELDGLAMPAAQRRIARLLRTTAESPGRSRKRAS
jgi:A/G-specific adenine glycosylase